MEKLRIKNRFVVASIALVVVLFGISIAYAAGKRSAVFEGQKVAPFQVRTANGKVVKFPQDYKGKVVLLDFWASWCGPCIRELPSVVAAYEKHHTNGFEILGVSLDRPSDQAKLMQVVRENKMTWPQAYDGQYFKTPLAVRFGVRSIPCPILIDGDTGLILAEGTNALGRKLSRAVEKGLLAKSTNQNLSASP